MGARDRWWPPITSPQDSRTVSKASVFYEVPMPFGMKVAVRGDAAAHLIAIARMP